MALLPKARLADQIDISEDQLRLIKSIFDGLPIVQGFKDSVGVIDFFSTIRKHP
jgi:hypothetical protein